MKTILIVPIIHLRSHSEQLNYHSLKNQRLKMCIIYSIYKFWSMIIKFRHFIQLVRYFQFFQLQLLTKYINKHANDTNSHFQLNIKYIEEISWRIFSMIISFICKIHHFSHTTPYTSFTLIVWKCNDIKVPFQLSIFTINTGHHFYLRFLFLCSVFLYQHQIYYHF